jgi:hypothetical protein
MSKVLIEADEIISAVSAVINPGDKLIVINGTLVSVAQGQQLSVEPVKAVKPILPDPGRDNKTSAQRSEILAAIARHSASPLNTGRLLNAMEIDPKSPRRKQYMQIINRMKVIGQIRPAPGDRDRPRPRWILAKP